MKIIDKIITIACISHLVIIITLLSGAKLRHDVSPFLALIDTFAPFLFLPLIMTLPLAFIMRSKVAVINSALATLIYLGLYGAYFLPPFTVSESPSNLRVMTFNTGLDLAPPAQIGAIIMAEQADLVALQEVTEPMGKLLLTEFSQNYSYMVVDVPTQTTVLLSRYPILHSEWLQFNAGERATLHGVIDYKGVSLNVLAVHPLPSGVLLYSQKLPIPLGVIDMKPQEQIFSLTTYAQTLPKPVIILGDFNLGERTKAYAELTTHFTDAYREAGYGLGLTFPYLAHWGNISIPMPLVRIDYIFHSPDLQSSHATVSCSGSSDHCYVITQLSGF